MKRKRAYEKLQSALLQRKCVRVVRVQDRADTVDGFVVAVSDDWFLVRQVDGNLSPSGWSALRVRDLFAVDKLESAGGVHQRVLETLGEWPPAVPTVCLIADLVGVIDTAQKQSPVVALHRETSRPDALWVGRVTAADNRHVTLSELDQHGEWDRQRVYDADDITRVEFGTIYLGHLALISGPAPV